MDLWRDEPLLYSTTSKGYSNRNTKYAAVHRIAQHFDKTDNNNVVLCVYDYDVKFLYTSSSLSRTPGIKVNVQFWWFWGIFV